MHDRLVILVPTILQAVFFFALGACVGSFVNVVAGRWPLGQDFVSPASRCTTCGRSLRWWENVPIVSWIALRGRCRTCGVWIGAGHLWVEVGMGVLFAGTVVLLYAGPFSSSPDALWWVRQGAWGTAPMLVSVLALWGCLVAASLIDAETGYIPLGITGLAWGVAMVMAVVQGAASGAPIPPGWPTGALEPRFAAAGLGGLIGIAAACVLLWKGWIPRSFASIDPERELSPSEARREVLLEWPFLALPTVGAVVGAWLLAGVCGSAVMHAVGSAGLGALVGGGVIWVTRIAGTLGFGREAMGLGDVHLLSAAGAVVGWRDALLAFLLAPFVALAWIAVRAVIGRLRGEVPRELPYGPHLAIAVVVVFLGRPWVVPLARLLFLPSPEAA